MPFKSEKQRKYLWANEPEIARDWTDTYGSRIHKEDGGNIRLQPHESKDLLVKKTSSGKRPKYQPPGGGATSLGSGRDHSGSDRGPRDAPDKHGPSKPSGNQAPDQGGHSRFQPDSGYYGHPGGVNPHAGWEKDVKNIEMARSLRPYHHLISDKATDYFPDWLRKNPNFKARTKFLKKAGILKEVRPDMWDTEDEELSWIQDPDILTSQWGLDRLRELGYVPNSDLHGQEGGGEGQPYIWPYPPTGIAALEEDPTQETLVSDTDWNFILPERFLKGPRVAQVAEGGRVPAAFGGIMDTTTGRRAYGLGSFNPFKAATKLVKKAAKTVKKIAKSPIGKLALGYLATAGIGNLMQPGAAQWGGGLKPGGWLKPGQVMSNWSNLMSGTSGLDKLNPNEMKNVASGWKGIPSKVMDFAKTPTGMITLGGAGIGLASATGPEKLEADIGGDRSEEKAWWDAYLASLGEDRFEIEDKYKLTSADGGRVPAETGGLMNLGGLEKDYRNDGGFVPIGKAERADDVPARLSKNEFVFTADAVRAAGGGDIDKGAEVMEDTMKTLEAKGGASDMFQTSQRLSEVI